MEVTDVKCVDSCESSPLNSFHRLWHMGLHTCNFRTPLFMQILHMTWLDQGAHITIMLPSSGAWYGMKRMLPVLHLGTGTQAILIEATSNLLFLRELPANHQWNASGEIYMSISASAPWRHSVTSRDQLRPVATHWRWRTNAYKLYTQANILF